MLFNASLWFHIIGISLLAGATIVDFMLTRKFWVIYDKHPADGIVARSLTDRVPALIVSGIVLILLSGVGMMIATRGVFDTMLWFRIKMVLVLVVILNGVLVGRRLTAQLKRVLVPVSHSLPDPLALRRVRRDLNLFHIFQLTLFLIIFLLSTFKFN